MINVYCNRKAHPMTGTLLNSLNLNPVQTQFLDLICVLPWVSDSISFTLSSPHLCNGNQMLSLTEIAVSLI